MFAKKKPWLDYSYINIEYIYRSIPIPEGYSFIFAVGCVSGNTCFHHCVSRFVGNIHAKKNYIAFSQSALAANFSKTNIYAPHIAEKLPSSRHLQPAPEHPFMYILYRRRCFLRAQSCALIGWLVFGLLMFARNFGGNFFVFLKQDMRST